LSPFREAPIGLRSEVRNSRNCARRPVLFIQRLHARAKDPIRIRDARVHNKLCPTSDLVMADGRKWD
jgi:hypothetical protein